MVIDARGRMLPAGGYRRVVSLVPSITETLFDLGAGDSLVGITDYCIFPPGLTLPRLGGTKNPRVARIQELEPDLVHMNLEENLKRHAGAIEEFAPTFVSEPKNVEDVIDLIRTLGDLHECRERADEFATSISEQRSRMTQRSYTFAVAIWKDPWMWCGGDTYVSNLVAATGGVNAFAQRQRYPAVPVGDVKADVIFLPDEPYAFTPEDAVRFGRSVIGPFPGHLVTWHGTRTLLGLRFLEDALSGRV